MSLLDFLTGKDSKASEAIKNGAVIIDVRTSAEFKQGHVKGSVNIPLNELEDNIDKIKKYNTVVTCCVSGTRSGSAKSILQKHGIKVFNGGSWQSLNK